MSLSEISWSLGALAAKTDPTRKSAAKRQISFIGGSIFRARERCQCGVGGFRKGKNEPGLGRFWQAETEVLSGRRVPHGSGARGMDKADRTDHCTFGKGSRSTVKSTPKGARLVVPS